jgi:HSP20 family molecular chaperone IbpA
VAKVPATKLAFSSLPAWASATPTFISGHEADDFEQAIYTKIGERARALFEESGRTPGNDEANWFRAESEVLRFDLQMRESGSWLALDASLPEASSQGMQILVRPRRVIVRAQQNAAEDHSGETANFSKGEIYVAANLSVEVEPQSAVASFRNRNLQLMIKKSQPVKLLGSPEAAAS